MKLFEPGLGGHFFVLGAIEKGCEALYFLQKLVPTLNREGHQQLRKWNRLCSNR